MSIEAMNWALTQRAGSPGAKAVLLILANRAHPDGRCWPGIDGIAEQTEMNRRTVIRNIQRLEDEGLLAIEHRGGDGTGRKTNVYKLLIADCKVTKQHKGQSANLSRQCDKNDKQSDTTPPEPKEEPKENPKRDAPDFEAVPNLNLDAWHTWQTHRQKRKLPKYKTDLKARELAALPHDAQMGCVEHSIGNEYAGLFPDKFRHGGPNRKPTYAEQLAEDLRRASNE